MEIERKFLVSSNYTYELDRALIKVDIVQYYISLQPEKRFRKIGNSFFYTEKGEGSLCREEIERTISEEYFKEMISHIVGNPIIKTRYMIPLSANTTAELDVYDANLHGLVVVEVEFGSVEDSQVFTKPSWFASEITNDARFKNKNLSMLEDVSTLSHNIL